MAAWAEEDLRVCVGGGPGAGSHGCLPAGLSQGTAGSTYVVLDFKNLNNYPCTLYGYPGVSLGGGVPVAQIGRSAAENPATPASW